LVALERVSVLVGWVVVQQGAAQRPPAAVAAVSRGGMMKTLTLWQHNAQRRSLVSSALQNGRQQQRRLGRVQEQGRRQLEVWERQRAPLHPSLQWSLQQQQLVGRAVQCHPLRPVLVASPRHQLRHSSNSSR
jgi:hypothetical protein